MYDEILIPTDGSEGIAEVLDHGIDLADRHGATVHTLYVVDRRLYLAAADDVQQELIETLEAEGEAAIEVVADRAREARVEVVTTVEDGIPYKAIVEYVEEHDIDLVVMGTHGRTGRDRLANLGSVTERVVKNVEVPVFVVHIGD